MLDAVPRTLSLDAAEVAHPYRLADVPTVLAGSALPEGLQVILDHLEPMPGVVLSPRYDVLAHNTPYEALSPGFLAMTQEERQRPWAEHRELHHAAV